ncbi:transcriptional repressor [Bacteroidales bacterium OttesenSCG-928-K22]|nr:transcriptional repressor [Bacteroidales bacterium OttesenSCG-928-L14]MDL2241145.1 transcriptional repressor [Bacteroidales bacterium OttesenSCG-928-K22]
MKKKNPDNIEIIKNIFLKHLEDNKMRVTGERLAVFDFVSKTDEHFEVDSLFADMRHYMNKTKFRISRATLYNTLDILVECGIVKKYQFAGKAFEYEFVKDIKEAHHHLINTETKKIIEFQDKRIDKIKRELEIKHGVVIDSCQLTFYAHNK